MKRYERHSLYRAHRAVIVAIAQLSCLQKKHILYVRTTDRTVTVITKRLRGCFYDSHCTFLQARTGTSKRVPGCADESDKAFLTFLRFTYTYPKIYTALERCAQPSVDVTYRQSDKCCWWRWREPINIDSEIVVWCCRWRCLRLLRKKTEDYWSDAF